MIDASEIGQFEIAAEPFNPPGKPLFGQRLPVVQGVAPSLPRLAEIVRRNTGHAERPAAVVELEEPPVRPDIGRVVGDEDRDVAHDADAQAVGVLLESPPLAVENEFDEGVAEHRITQLAAVALQGVGVPVADIPRPFIPWAIAEVCPQCTVKDVVVEPARLATTEPVKGFQALLVGALAPEPFGCPVQQRFLDGMGILVVRFFSL